VALVVPLLILKREPSSSENDIDLKACASAARLSNSVPEVV